MVGAVTALQNKLSCLLLLMVTLANAFGLAVRRLRHHKHYYCACTLNLVALYLYAASGISFWQADRFNIVWYPLLLFCLAFHIHWISKELQRYFLSNSKI